MRTVAKLTLGFLRQHPVRSLLTVLATTAATCLVLWMVSGYEGLLRSYDVYAERALGRYTLSVDPISRKWDRRVLPEVVEALRNDPQVSAAEPMWAERVVIQSQAVKLQAPPPGSGSQPGEGVNECLLLGTDAPAPPFDLVRGRWIGEEREDTEEPGTIDVAVSVQIADRYGVDVGDALIVGREESSQPLRVVGIVDNPPVPITGRSAANMDLPSPSIAGIYARMDGAATILKREPVVTFVGLCLKEGTDVHAFRYAWGPRLSAFDEPAQFQEDHDLEEQLDEAAAAKNLKLQSFLATFMAMLLAFLVIFNTLSMGVSERTRQFAMLRAIVLTRAQVAQLVFAESLFIAALGFAGGLAAGEVLLSLAGSFSSSMWRHGAHIGPLAVVLAAVASFGAATLAAFIPAWKATRVRPLDAMVPSQSTAPGNTKWHWFWSSLGLVLVGLAPVLTFVFPPTSEQEAKGRLICGVLALAVGFLLLAPAIVRLVDRFAGPALAKAIGLSPKLLAQQLTCHIGRTVASAIALSVGLTLYISIQVWGYTLLETFVPGRWTPDLQVSFEPYGLTDRAAEEVARLPGIDADRCAPVVVEQPRLREDLTGSAERASVTRQDNVVLIGIDPAKAIGGDSPLLDFSYVRGTRDGALAAMQTDRGCIVPEHFLHETGLKIGDRFELVPPENPKHPVAYTIAASVQFQGWHWMTKIGGLRVRTHRAAALVIADFQTVRADFDLFKARHVWLRYETPATHPSEIAKAVRNYYSSTLGEDVRIGRPKRTEVDSLMGSEGERGSQGRPAAYIEAVSADDVRRAIRGNASRWLWAASVMPLVAVAIGSVGMLTVVISSVRARQWEMGVLRALGFSRGTLVRLVVAEGLLVGIVACVLSLGFGIMAGWCGTGLSSYMSFFGGLQPVLVVPPAALLIGLVAVLLFAALAAIGPAVRVGRTHPLELLQQGRTAL
ncbi:MAG: ABC transporter permease [Planctomycetaceae bacterium]|nr:ABC transporter permease [Planctomycetaceae bacterium]